MKKKLVTILCILLLLWGGMFVTDFVRCNSLKKPLFVVGISDTLLDDGGSGTYRGLGYTVEVEGDLIAVEGELPGESGFVVQSVEMRVLDRVIAASVT